MFSCVSRLISRVLQTTKDYGVMEIMLLRHEEHIVELKELPFELLQYLLFYRRHG